MNRPLSGRFWLTAAVVIFLGIAALLINANSTARVGPGGSPQIVSYVVLDQHTVAIAVLVANFSWTRVTNIVESPTDARVTVESLYWPVPLPQTASLEKHWVVAALAEDLGTRVLRDADGQPIPAH
jgi:hypothetical protein